MTPRRQHVPHPGHIDHALVGRPHPRMYLLHKWWARKPHNIVRQYVETYSRPGEAKSVKVV